MKATVEITIKEEVAHNAQSHESITKEIELTKDPEGNWTAWYRLYDGSQLSATSKNKTSAILRCISLASTLEHREVL